MRCSQVADWTNHYPNGPYLDTTCKNCGEAIEHTGADSGMTWVEVGSREVVGAYLGRWECGPCPECPGAVFHQHIPLDVVTEAAVLEVVAGINAHLNGEQHE